MTDAKEQAARELTRACRAWITATRAAVAKAKEQT